MENASKALSMAAGILIAVLTISLLIYAFSSSGNLLKTEDDIEANEQMRAFNREYESYNKKLLRGTDVISVCNKASSNNEKYKDEKELQISIYFIMIEPIVYYKKDVNGNTVVSKKPNVFEKNKKYDMSKINELDKDAFTDFKRRVFNCTEVKYNKTTGRITEMVFTEQDINYAEGL